MKKKIENKTEEDFPVYCVSWSKVFGKETLCKEHQCNKYIGVPLPVDPEDQDSETEIKTEIQYFCLDQMNSNALQALVMELIYLNETLDEMNQTQKVTEGLVEQPKEEIEKKERDINAALFG
jgi:hypothetical protein